MLTIISTAFWIGLAASLLTALSQLPQVIKIIKEKRAENVSALMIAVLLAGIAGWVVYGWLIEDWLVIASNSLSFVINLWLAYMMYTYRKQ